LRHIPMPKSSYFLAIVPLSLVPLAIVFMNPTAQPRWHQLHSRRPCPAYSPCWHNGQNMPLLVHGDVCLDEHDNGYWFGIGNIDDRVGPEVVLIFRHPLSTAHHSPHINLTILSTLAITKPYRSSDFSLLQHVLQAALHHCTGGSGIGSKHTLIASGLELFIRPVPIEHGTSIDPSACRYSWKCFEHHHLSTVECGIC
jgi:hypothetical protein